MPAKVNLFIVLWLRGCGASIQKPVVGNYTYHLCI